tara:strand:+ start:550 stop:942 length:393 start_codon:yes stop_codon:yes gene_type:complete
MKTLLKLPLLLLVLILIISSCDKIASPKSDAKKLAKIQEKLENNNDYDDFSDDEYFIVLEDYVEILEKHLKSREKWEKFNNEMKKYDELSNVNTDYDNMRSTVEAIKTFILKENNKKEAKVEATTDEEKY